MASLAELTSRLKTSGHDYLADPVAEQLVKEAVSELGLQVNWPWRERTDTVAYGAVIPDRGNIRQVITFQGWPILPEDVDELREDLGPLLSTVGTPEVYWIEGRNVLRTYMVPPAGQPLQVVQYARIMWTQGGGAPTNSADTPLIPGDFDDLIVYTARLRALAGSDEAGLVQMILGLAAPRMTELLDQEGNPNVDEPDYVRAEGDWA